MKTKFTAWVGTCIVGLGAAATLYSAAESNGKVDLSGQNGSARITSTQINKKLSLTKLSLFNSHGALIAESTGVLNETDAQKIASEFVKTGAQPLPAKETQHLENSKLHYQCSLRERSADVFQNGDTITISFNKKNQHIVSWDHKGPFITSRAYAAGYCIHAPA